MKNQTPRERIVPNRIKTTRLDNLMSQGRLAELAGLTQSTVSLAENGRECQEITKYKIAKALNSRVDILFPSRQALPIDEFLKSIGQGDEE